VRLLGASNPLGRRPTYHSRHRFVSTEGANWYDRGFVTGVILLVTLSPLPMGAVHPWAFIALELAIGGLVLIWMAKTAIVEPIQYQPAFANLRPIALPLALFIAFAALAMLPMPPVMLRLLSPSTYTLYAKTLPGWPNQAPYRDLLKAAASVPSVARPLSYPSRQTEAAPNPRTPTAKAAALEETSKLASEASDAPRWMPLSIAPPLTLELLIKIAAYAALFFAVMLYPFGPSMNGVAEKRFYRYVLVAIMATGLFVACVGILERVFWNGKILWIFVPYDWGRAQPTLFGRARGPFVNPDHFASYLNLILPVAIAGMLFPTFVTRRNSEPFRVFCAVVAVVTSIALLLSMSRAGWLGAVVGVSTLVFLSRFIAIENRPWIFRLRSRVTVPLCAIAVIVILATTSVFVGDRGRHEADVRLKDTISNHQSLHFRVNVWRDSLPMIRDFPLFGMGLGAFEDAFAHFQSPPWNPNQVREAHNDYLELLVSAGVIGFGFLAWFFTAAARRLYRGLPNLPADVLPVAAALLAGMGAMAFQEFFDFNLQIPAVAFLFTLIFAMAMRLVVVARLDRVEAAPSRSQLRVIAATAAAAVIVVSILAVGQNKIPYPYSLEVPSTVASAREGVLAHPALSLTHVWMAAALGPRISPAARAHELASAAWLDPTDPRVRDLYAQSLIFAGRPNAALKQVTLSVYNSPWLDNHFYLTADNRTRLTPADRAAVETGLKMAVARNFKNAVWALGGFYDALHEYPREARLYVKAAGTEPDPGLRSDLLVAAGRSFADAGNFADGEKYLREAAALDPTSPDPYRYLATDIFAPEKRLRAARAAIDEGIRNGADPFRLELALAAAARRVGDNSTEEKALVDASNIRPSNAGAAIRLGQLYMREKRFDQAVLILKRAAELHPDSPQVLDKLGLAEEANYQFYAAGTDLSRAAELAPDNAAIKADYQDFQKRSSTASGGASFPTTARRRALPGEPEN
jgi:O-antigen ligase/tetratricopeptide (TPR) repeat protein